MNTRLRTLTLAIGLLTFLPFLTLGQEYLTGLTQNTILVKASRHYFTQPKVTTAVKLPFVEDFSKGMFYPDSLRWADRQAFVNSTYPIFPPTIGVATLDALDASGKVYAHANTDIFPADTLTSVPIRLDSNFTHHREMRIGDSLYFSFYYQPGGGCARYPAVEWERIGDAPEEDDVLLLEFGYATGNMVFIGYAYGEYIVPGDEYHIVGDTIENPFMPGSLFIVEENAFPGDIILMPCDSLFGPEYVWNQVWSAEGCSLDDWLDENPLQYFKQVMIPITDPQYLRNNFQFRFRNYASLDLDTWSSNNIIGWASNCDQWHIDYIRLNTDRNADDLYPNDVAFVAPTTSALKNYQSMPWHQYRSTDMAAQFQNQLANVSNSVKNTFYNYKVTKNGGNIFTSTVNNENAMPFSTNGLHDYIYHATPNIEFSYTYDGQDSALFVITHVFRMEGANDELRSNDTCVFEQKFQNYYAYDDGTAESGYCLLSSVGSPAASLAVQFTLAEPDTLRCVRMWFNNVLNDENIDEFTLMVWDDNDGLPGNVIYSQEAQLPYQAEDFLDFANYYLDEPVAVSGTFYVGFFQNHNTQLNLGFDQNNDARGHFFYKTTNEWRSSYYKGAPMVRPVVGKFFDHSGIINHLADNVSVKFYPNPATNVVFVEMADNDLILDFQIFDAYGRLLRTGDLSGGSISVQDLSSGIYIIKLLKNNQIIQTEKLIKQ